MEIPFTLLVETLVRLAGVMVVVLYVWPKVALPPYPDLLPLDRTVSGAARIVLFMMVVGYVLVVLRLFEWPILVAALVLLHLSRPSAGPNLYRLPFLRRVGARILEELDHLATWPQRILREGWRQIRGRPLHRPPLIPVLGTVAALVILGGAAWLRFHMAWVHAALPFSDGYVVVYWVKAIDNQILFPNGIYPEGFHIFIAEMGKLAFANTVVFIKFFGPTVGLFMTLSVGYTAYRLSGSIGAGLLALAVYGVVPHLLPYDLSRQVATDSQEFGNALVVPVAYFTYRAWTHPREAGFKETALALVVIVGLVHTLALLNAVLAFLSGTLAAWAIGAWPRRVLAWFAGRLGVGALLVIAPFALALLAGIPPNASSVSFAGSETARTAPLLTRLEDVALLAPLALALLRVARRRSAEEVGSALVGFFLMAFAVAVQLAPLVGLHSLVLESRYMEDLALVEAVALGLLWAFGEEFVGWATGERPAQALSLAGALAFTAYAWRTHPPVPPAPYTMNSDAFVAQYLRIADTELAGTWQAVSEDEGFALAYGEGFQMTPQTWVAHASPDGPWPTYGGRTLAMGEVFFFVHRRFHDPHVASIQGVIDARLRGYEAGNRELEAWLRVFVRHHGPLKVFYRGKDLTIYEIDAVHGGGGP